jgi:glucokinase
MFVVFVGTGIGGALILEGKLYRGSSNYAGEIGHTLVEKKGKFKNQRKSGSTFEETASRTAVAQNIADKIKKGKSSTVSKLVKKNKRIKSGALSDAVDNKDKVVTKELKKASKTIGTVLGSITTLMNFDTIVLGGGVIEAMGDYLIPKIEKSFKKAVLSEPGKIVRIYPTKLGDDAPILGGIVLAEEFLNNK